MKRTMIAFTGLLLMSSSIVRADVYDTVRSSEQFSAEEVKATEAVLTYLDECSVFWDMDRGRLKKWSDAIKTDDKNVFDKRIRF